MVFWWSDTGLSDEPWIVLLFLVIILLPVLIFTGHDKLALGASGALAATQLWAAGRNFARLPL